MEGKKIICIRCPRGCEITTTLDGYTITSIAGNVCKLGAEYVEKEIKDPRRVVTTTIKVRNGIQPLVPVWTNDAIPKEKIFDLMILLKDIELEAPVDLEKIVLENIFNSGVNVVTSGKVFKKEDK